MSSRPTPAGTSRSRPALLTATALLAVGTLVGLVLRAPWRQAGSLLTSGGALQALRLSLVTATASTAVALVLGVPLAWLLAQQPWIVPIPGTRRRERLDENAGATAVGLSADETADLNSLAARVGVSGDRYNQAMMGLVGR